MFEPIETELMAVTEVVFADRTYRSKRALSRFLATLSPSQLAQTEVLVDDDTFVVFYPLLDERNNRHFDTSDSRGSRSASKPTLSQEIQFELSGGLNCKQAKILAGI
jgi:hypothetical protein